MTVYLLHFSRPYISSGGKKRPQHYLGATTLPLVERLARHRSGRGAALLQAATAAGITFETVRTWIVATKDDAFQLEIKLKRGRNHRKLCPRCTPHD